MGWNHTELDNQSHRMCYTILFSKKSDRDDNINNNKVWFFMFLNLIYLYGVDVVLENVASVAEIFSASHENHLLRCEDEF